MKSDGPYHVMIVSTTGGKPILNMGPGFLRVIVLGFLVLVIGLLVLTYLVIDSYRVNRDLRTRIEAQVGEIKALNVEIARKDEEIISLKKQVAPAIDGQRIVIKEITKAPKVYPPTVGLQDISITDTKIMLKVVNIKVQEVASGHLFAVFHGGGRYVSYPPVAMDGGVPSIPDRGLPFTIHNYKQMVIHIPSRLSRWDNVTFYVFDSSGKLRLVHSMPREEVSSK